MNFFSLDTSKNGNLLQRIGCSLLNTVLVLCAGFSLLYPSASTQAQEYGLDAPQPVAAFLNGNLPVKTPGSGGAWQLVEAFPSLTFSRPVFFTHQSGTDTLFVVEEGGRIWFFDNDPGTVTKTLFLDRSADTRFSGDSGMLNMVFHPEYGQPGSPNRGYVYVFYRYTPDQSITNGSSTPAYCRLSRFTVPDGQEVADPASETVLIQQFDRHDWHNGGAMFFGNDGFLYVTLGDEGGANDVYDDGQKIDEGLLAGVLRIDVDQDPARSHPILRQPQNPGPLPAGWPDSFSANYFIPNDNPWVDPTGNTLEEFYAIGLRSPHTMSFDTISGQIWIGDVGQGTREEISLLRKGANFQWPYREGNIAGPKAKPAALIGFDQPPVWDYDRGEGSCVIGGVVYRGNDHATELFGKYLFADCRSRNIWALTYSEGQQPAVELLAQMPDTGGGANQISAWGVDRNNEVYLCKPTSPNSKIQKLVRTGGLPDPPQLLSQTGAFTNLATLEVTPGVIPYEVNTPLWSDGAAKKRWIALPNDGTHDTAGERIAFSENGPWRFPIGSVLIKHFEIGTDENDPAAVRRLETRFLVLDEDGSWYGVTYRWLLDGSDAQLLVSSFEDDITIALAGGGTESLQWHYPSRSECATCHTPAAGHVLGVKARQLNLGNFYPTTGRTSNQLKTMNHLGMFDPPVDESAIASFLTSPSVNDTSQPSEKRARAYLDSNCSQCHRPQGGTQATFDAVLSTPPDLQKIVDGDVQNDLGIAGAKVVVPVDLSRSILYQRINSLDGCCAMPPLAKNRLDSEAIGVIANWINSLDPALAPPSSFPGPDGVAFEYFEGNWSSLPDFDALTPVSTGTAANFDIGLRQREDLFAFRFRGKIRIDASGTYTFYTQSDDGSRLLINGAVVVDNDGLHSLLESSGSLVLTEGYHDIEVQMFENTGSQALMVSFEGHNLQKQSLPSSKLFLPGTVEPDLVSPVPVLGAADAQVSGPFLVNAIFTEPVSGVALADFNMVNGSAGNLTGSGSSYSIEVTPGSAGSVTVEMPADRVVDGIGNANMASNVLSVNYTPDPGLLTVTLSTPDAQVSGPFEVSAVFSAPVTGLIESDFLVTNGTVQGLSGSAASYTLTIAPISAGLVTVGLPSDAAIDGSGAGNQASNVLSVTHTDSLSQNLLLHLKFDEASGTVAIDSSGKGHDGQFIDGATRVAGRIGQAVLFDGIDDHVFVPGTLDLRLGDNNADFTVACWIDLREDITGNWRVLMQKGANWNQRTPSLFLRDDSNRVHYRSSTATTWNMGGDGVAALPVNAWTHVVLTKSGNVLTLYLDGSADAAVTLAEATIANDGGFYFGWCPWASGSKIALDEVRVYDRLLTAAEIQTLAGEGGGPDTVSPAVVLTTPVSQVSGEYAVDAVFSESVAGLVASDFSVSNGVAGVLSGSGASYTLSVLPGSAGEVTVSLPAASAADPAGNGNLASNSISVTFVPADSIPPVVVLSTSSTEVTGPFAVVADFDEPVTGFTLSDLVVQNGTASVLNGSLASYSFTVTPAADGAVTINLPAGVVFDAAGNPNTASNTLSVNFTDPGGGGGGPVAPDAVAWWAFEEGSGAITADETGNGNDGVLSNGVQWVPGRIGGGLQFDGIDSVMEVADSAFLQLGDLDADYSVAFWIQSTGAAAGSWRSIMQKATTWSDRTFSFFLDDDSERIDYRASTETVWNSGGSSVGGLATNVWTHVVSVKEGSALTLYLDGAVDSSVTLGAAIVSNSGSLYLGKSPEHSGLGAAMVVDELQLYQRALTVAEVALLATGGDSGSGDSAGGDPATVTWEDWKASRGLVNYSGNDLHEFAFGTTPENSELYGQGLQLENSGGEVSVVYDRLAGREGIECFLEVSSDLEVWFRVEPSEVEYEVSVAGGLETVRYSGLENLPELFGSSCFVRLILKSIEPGG